MEINMFLNELSLVGQFGDNVEERLHDVIKMLNVTLNDLKGTVYYNESVFAKCMLTKDYAVGSMDSIVKKHLVSRDVACLFRSLYSKMSPVLMLQSVDKYTVNKSEDCSKSILSNAYESVEVEPNVIISSFPGTKYDVPKIEIIKNGDALKIIPNVTSYDGYMNYLSCQGLLNRYDKRSRVPPTDEQGIFSTNGDFMYTGKREQNTERKRKVYQRKSTGDYWYIDSMHFDGSAHYEVFRPDLTMKGTLNFFEEDIDNLQPPKKNERKRTLTMA